MSQWVTKGVASDPHDFNHSCTCPTGFEGKNCESCTDGRLSCENESNEMNCVLHDDYCIGRETCPNGNDFLCPPQGQGHPSYCDSSEEFACINEYNVWLNVCIPKEKKCDGNSECPNGKDEDGCDDFFPWWIWLIIALVVLLIVVLITVCICKRKRGKFEPNQEKNTQIEIEAPTINPQTKIETPTMTKDKAREILFKPDKQTISKQTGAIPKVPEHKVGD